jgi:xanthine dehydrogenase large subunit
VAGDCPPILNAWLWERGENRREVAHRSRAVGEPPLMLALSVFHALYDAVGAASNSRNPVPLEAPATPENILKALCQSKS